MAVRDRRLATLAAFAALTVIHTWPLAGAPGTWSRADNADALLNEWILAWVARTVFTDPLGLFHANIFFPEPYTLAYSEHLVVQGVLAAPLLWLGASPLLAHNLVLLAGLVLTGWVTSMVVTKWTGCWTAGFVAGCLVVFNSHTFTRMAHVQASHAWALPLALVALDRLLTAPRVRRAGALAAAFTLQALCSGYLLVLTAVALVAATLARASEWIRRDRIVRAAWHLGLATTMAGVALAPFLWPYAQVRRLQGLSRTLDEVGRYSAVPGDYLATVSRLHYEWWSHAFFRSDAFFPGALAVALALVAIVSGRAWSDPRARMLLLMAVAGFALSLGPAFPPYGVLYQGFPLLEGIRGAARFGYLVLVGVAGLAGFGTAWIAGRLQARWPSGRPRRLASLALGAVVVLVNVEAFAAPLHFVRAPGVPAIHRVLAAEANAVVVDLPLPEPGFVSRNARTIAASTAHWKPMVNGYSGFVPRSYVEHYEALSSFPDPSTFDAMREIGVTHLVVRLDEVPGAEAALSRRPDVDLIAVEGALRVYRLRPRADGRTP